MTAGCPNRQRRHTPSSWTTPNPDTTLLGLYFQQPARLIAAWLSGYYNAKRNNRVIDLQALEENMSKVTNYCSDEKNFKVPVMKAVEQVLARIHRIMY